MFTLSTYLIGALLSIYLFSPKNNVGLWKGVLTIPLILTSVYIFYFLTESNTGYGYSMFKFGATFSKCIIPLIISCGVIYFLLKKKMKNDGKVKFPLILVALSVITLGFSIYEENLEFELKQNSKKVNILQEETNRKIALNGIKDAIASIKARLPINTDDGLVLYNINLNEEKKEVKYYYRSDSDDVSDLTENEISNYKTQWKEQTLQIATKSNYNQEFIIANISMNYILEDKNGEYILDFIISPDEYK